ncbi:MAG TPA: cell division protein SepF [Solirubrobacteraceae bacterium]|nr:cell division protein SepF [Solirubrobacteraceae bacterium]
MSGMWRKTLVYLGLVEEPDGVDEEYAALHAAEPPPSAPAPRPVSLAPVPTPDPAPRRDATVRPLHGSDEGSGHVRPLTGTARVAMVHVTAFDDARDIGDRYRSGQPVLIDVTAVDNRTARRVLDFAGGVTFALRGRIAPAGDRAYLLLQEGAEVTPEERRRLAGFGYRVDAASAPSAGA